MLFTFFSCHQEFLLEILGRRRSYKLGPERITWYKERYHEIKTSVSSVYRTLVRNDIRRLPKSSPRRAIHTRRYAKEVPGHHIQVDVKFVSLRNFDTPESQAFSIYSH